MKINILTLFIALSALNCPAANKAANYLHNPPMWYSSVESAQIASNIISHQSPLGGWTKNTDTTSKPYTGNPLDIKPTFDNGATVDELRFLAIHYNATKSTPSKTAFLKGFDYIIKAQYPNGGFPQCHPPGNGYHKHITFNDSTMVRLLEFLRETANSEVYKFLDEERRKQARQAFEKGIDCILKCQIKINGKLTAWCAQHDETTLEPRGARTFELPSISGCESVGIVRLLMSIEKPSPEIITSIRAAIEWFKSSKIEGIRIVEKNNPTVPTTRDRVVVKDPAAPPLWARFYEIETNKPIFADRDGVKKYNLSEIGHERRNGYAWYGNWAQKLIEREYPEWEKRISSNTKNKTSFNN
ncbi:MAG: pectate lyase [Verrucomicrobiae bacterium]|nr:pectate lyase [Verrucomicrobiae bacterium]